MTDQTTARDRAIEQAEEIVASDYEHSEASPELPWAAYTLMNEAKRLSALAGAPTADVAEDLPARLRAAADEAWEIRGITAAIKLGELARTLDKYPADAVEAIARVLAAAPEGAPTADVAAHVCEPPDLDESARSYGARRWDCPVDGIRWVLVKRMIDRKMHAEWRRMPGQPAAPEGMDAADEQDDLLAGFTGEDGVQGWLVGAGLDIERDGTGPTPSIRIGGAEQPVQRVRALRDALSAALDGDTTEEA